LVSALVTSALARRSGRDAARLCRGGHAPHRPATAGERATAIRSRGHGGTQQQQCAAHRRLQYRAAPSPCATPFLSRHPLTRPRAFFAWPHVGRRGTERDDAGDSTGTDRPLPSFPRAPLSSEASSLPCLGVAGPLDLSPFCHRPPPANNARPSRCLTRSRGVQPCLHRAPPCVPLVHKLA
jgi:hypothetical protein